MAIYAATGMPPDVFGGSPLMRALGHQLVADIAEAPRPGPTPQAAAAADAEPRGGFGATARLESAIAAMGME